MKFTHIILSFLFLTFLSCGGDKWETLENESFTVDYPSDWRLDESGRFNSKFFLFAQTIPIDGFNENINLMVETLPNPNITMQQYIEASIKGLDRIPNSKVINQREFDRDGINISEIEWTGFMNNMDLKTKQQFQKKDGKVYMLTYTAKPDSFKKYVDDASKIMNSFRVK